MANPEHFEVLVVGGGIHGAGVAQAAAAAGYSVLLVEKTAWAAGTSSKSSKLIHGGLRYLESLQFNLVRHSLAEQAVLLNIAPNLVRRVPFYIPIYETTRRKSWQIRIGLSLYALLGGLNKHNKFRQLPRTEWKNLDGLNTDELVAVFQYWDAQTDDRLLTEAVVHSAQKLGATTACPATLVSATHDTNGVDAIIKDEQLQRERDIHADVLINCAGPWINHINRSITPTPKGLGIEWARGSHIVIPGSLGEKIFYLESPWDFRAVFAMPWYGNTLVGTTESLQDEEPEKTAPGEDEITYLQDTIAHYFNGIDTTVIESFAGLRVLPEDENTNIFHRNRDVQLIPDNQKKPRIISIYGGKLTAYRLTAEQAVLMAKRTLPTRTAKGRTDKIIL
jgi:glycerol-3-phosphate dehydrogenase